MVCAADFLSDAGMDLAAFAEHVRQQGLAGHPAPKYVIFNRRIASRSRGWTWRSYHGRNPHTNHVHVSVGRGPDGRSTGPYDDRSPWGLTNEGDEMIGLSRGDEGQEVKGLQATLRRAGFDPGKVDGIYGPKTSTTVLTMRKSQGSSVSSGDFFSGHAYSQLMSALADRRAGRAADEVLKEAKRAIEQALAGLPDRGVDLPDRLVLDLPDTITVPVEPAEDDD